VVLFATDTGLAALHESSDSLEEEEDPFVEFALTATAAPTAAPTAAAPAATATAATAAPEATEADDDADGSFGTGRARSAKWLSARLRSDVCLSNPASEPALEPPRDREVFAGTGSGESAAAVAVLAATTAACFGSCLAGSCRTLGFRGGSCAALSFGLLLRLGTSLGTAKADLPGIVDPNPLREVLCRGPAADDRREAGESPSPKERSSSEPGGADVAAEKAKLAGDGGRCSPAEECRALRGEAASPRTFLRAPPAAEVGVVLVLALPCSGVARAFGCVTTFVLRRLEGEGLEDEASDSALPLCREAWPRSRGKLSPEGTMRPLASSPEGSSL